MNNNSKNSRKGEREQIQGSCKASFIDLFLSVLQRVTLSIYISADWVGIFQEIQSWAGLIRGSSAVLTLQGECK